MPTHNIAVGAYIIKDNRILLLFRNAPPCLWAPPGGHLLKNEDPEQGLRREVYEESGLSIEVICPTAVWHGNHKGAYLIAVFFLCSLQTGDLTLCDEHSSARWFTLDEVREHFQREGGTIFGNLIDYERAFSIFNMLEQKESLRRNL